MNIDCLIMVQIFNVHLCLMLTGAMLISDLMVGSSSTTLEYLDISRQRREIWTKVS